ncbi:MAG: sigma-54-dependent Fis family transcriptional regulator [Deltaproteobacteria bacterium]|nr:sigma-54-dependent Fis family transcriptional regulator [Deltaproteobacteria bacterium]
MQSTQFPSLPVLMVDDEEHLLISFDTVLRTNGINNILLCHDARGVAAVLAQNQVGVMLLDLIMPHISGEEILGSVSRDFPEIPIIVVTGVDEIDKAVKCVKSGAFDYMVKPVEEGRLFTSVKRAIDYRELQLENIALKTRIISRKLDHPEAFAKIVTVNETMHGLFQYAEAIADSPMPILITGETGVGKELMVNAIHSLRACKGGFVKVNVAGLDDNMFADTLFGHKKGAFTGADKTRGGLIERASGGTLFLDEIGDLAPTSQIKLLRLLQDREYYPVGGDLPQFTDTRIIAATSLILQDLFRSDAFRMDLYYRLQTHHLHIPPLRERIEDIRVLLPHFLQKASREMGKKTPTPPKELYTLLSGYHFQGNIRELQSMVYDAVSKHESGNLPMNNFVSYMDERRSSNEPNATKSESKVSFHFSPSEPIPTLKEAEESLIAEALRRSKGNQSIAARLLGISRQALNRRMKAKSGRSVAD